MMRWKGELAQQQWRAVTHCTIFSLSEESTNQPLHIHSESRSSHGKNTWFISSFWLLLTVWLCGDVPFALGFPKSRRICCSSMCVHENSVFLPKQETLGWRRQEACRWSRKSVFQQKKFSWCNGLVTQGQILQPIPGIKQCSSKR